MIAAPGIDTTSQPAVIATRPASEPLRVMDTSGLPYFIQVIVIATIDETAGATVVVIKTLATESLTA